MTTPRPRYITDEPKTLAEYAEILRLFNTWRRWDDDTEDSPQMPEPRLIGKAIDAAVKCMTERAK